MDYSQPVELSKIQKIKLPDGQIVDRWQEGSDPSGKAIMLVLPMQDRETEPNRKGKAYKYLAKVGESMKSVPLGSFKSNVIGRVWISRRLEKPTQDTKAYC